ncbi:MAG: hypothetical protein U1F41_16015 [Burkholderiales bacterium]
MRPLSKLRAGDWVEVRGEDEILRTLDANGEIDGMPFMPEMLKFCGKRFRVWKRAHKTCDTVHKTGGRWLDATVHLEELRCDGSSHGGCEAACLLFWKHAWLKPVDGPDGARSDERPSPARAIRNDRQLGPDDLARCTRADPGGAEDVSVYRCQATRLPAATRPLAWWDVRQYVLDVTSRNVTVGRVLSSFCYSVVFAIGQAGIGLGRPVRALYDAFQRLRGGIPWPRRRGSIPAGAPTPVADLGLQPGEWVRVKPLPEILSTLDSNNKNRGLYFDCEEVPFCGGRYQVKGRVTRIIDERSGRMMDMKTPSVILAGVYCEARYSDRRLFCPRAIHPMWREIWLERAPAPSPRQSRGSESSGA